MNFRDLMEPIVTVMGLIILVAIIAILVSKKAQTPAVIQSVGSAFGNSLGVAESPVTGETYNIDLSYPDSSLSSSAFAPLTSTSAGGY